MLRRPEAATRTLGGVTQQQVDTGRIQLNLAAEVMRKLQEDPQYQFVTFDNVNWIDPITGKLIPAPFDWRASAQNFLLGNRHWRRYPAKSIEELIKIRWAHFLRDNLQKERRLRLFNSDWHWLNPITARWSDSVIALDGVIDLNTLKAMAVELSASADSEPTHLLPFDQLLRIQQMALRSAPRRPSGLQTGPLPNPAELPQQRSSTPPIARKAHSTESFITGPAGIAANGAPRTMQFLKPVAVPKQGASAAAAVQQKMLKGLVDIPGFETAVCYEPYEEIGGDFYDVIPLVDGRYMVIVGDVSGHGAQAALIVSSALKTLRLLAETQSFESMVDFACAFNDTIFDDLVAGQFLACFMALVDPERATVDVVSAGLHDALVANPSSRDILDRIGTKGMAIGLMAGSVLKDQLQVASYRLRKGDTICFYTDGLSESHNPAGEEYGHFMAAGSFVSKINKPCQTIVDFMHQQTELFSQGNIADDLTVLVLRYNPSDDQIPELTMESANKDAPSSSDDALDFIAEETVDGLGNPGSSDATQTEDLTDL